MKTLFMLLIVTLCQGSTPAPSDAPPVLVVKHSWTNVRYRQGWDANTFPDARIDPRTPIPTPRRRMGRLIEGFSYKATIKNLSQKTTVLIIWNYAFKEADEGQFSNHQFLSRIKIRPGRHKEVDGFTKKPPTRTVSAGDDKNLEGDVIVDYVEYEDGTAWRRAEPRGSVGLRLGFADLKKHLRGND